MGILIETKLITVFWKLIDSYLIRWLSTGKITESLIALIWILFYLFKEVKVAQKFPYKLRAAGSSIMIDDKISCRQSLKRKGDFLEKYPHEKCSFAWEYILLKKEIHVLYFWISILVIIGKKALLANADSKDLCLE